MTYLLKTHKTLTVFAILAFIVILMPLQDVYAATTGVTINFPLAGETAGDNAFTVRYTLAADNGADANTGFIRFTESGTTLDPDDPHTYTMVGGDRTTGQHDITLDFLEANFDVPDTLIDGATYDIRVEVNSVLNGPLVATELVIAMDFTLPTFTAALAPASNQITITYSENVISAANSPDPWAVTGGFTVNAVTNLDGGTNTQTLTLDGGIPDGASIVVTYTVGGAGDITDDISRFQNDLATATVSLGGVPPFSGQGSGCTGDCSAPTLGVNSEGDRFVTNGFTYNGQSTDVEYFYTPYPLITANTVRVL